MPRANPVVMVRFPVCFGYPVVMVRLCLGGAVRSIDYSNPASPSFCVANHGREWVQFERWFAHTTRSAVIALVQRAPFRFPVIYVICGTTTVRYSTYFPWHVVLVGLSMVIWTLLRLS